VKLSYTRALNDPALLGPFFAGPSWSLTKAVVAAMNAEPLSEVSEIAFCQCSGRQSPADGPREYDGDHRRPWER
jgi:hypothetical protein